jgi:hypothetical protein
MRAGGSDAYQPAQSSATMRQEGIVPIAKKITPGAAGDLREHDLQARTHKTALPVLSASDPSSLNLPINRGIGSARPPQNNKSFSAEFAIQRCKTPVLCHCQQSCWN